MCENCIALSTLINKIYGHQIHPKDIEHFIESQPTSNKPVLMLNATLAIEQLKDTLRRLGK